MAKGNTHKITDREIEIANTIRGVVTKISGPMHDLDAAKRARLEADEKEQGSRVDIILNVAALACQSDWTDAEINYACDYARDVQGNDKLTSKTIATLASEMRNVASVKTRHHVANIHKICELAWQLEVEETEMAKAAGEDAPATPISKAFKRFYHLFIAAVRETRKNDNFWLETSADVVEWAIACDPDNNPENLAKKLAAALKTINAAHDLYAHPDLPAVGEILARLSGDKGKAIAAYRVTEPHVFSRKRPAVTTTPAGWDVVDTSVETEESVSTPVSTPEPVATNVPTPAPAPSEPLVVVETVSSDDDVAEGVADIMDDFDAADALLNGDAHTQLAIAA